MKIATWGVALGALLLLASAAFADSADPRVGLGGSGSNQASCSESPSDPTCIQSGSSISASVVTDSSGDAIVDIMDETGQVLPSVTVTINSSFTGPITCELEESDDEPVYFGNATPSGSNACVFSGPPAEGVPAGVPNGDVYGVYLFGFASGSTVSFTASSPLPEPGSLALLGMGLLSLALFRKKILLLRSNA